MSTLYSRKLKGDIYVANQHSVQQKENFQLRSTTEKTGKKSNATFNPMS